MEFKILITLLLIFIIFHQNCEYINIKPKVYLFHRPGCPHCENMKPAWNKLKKKMASEYELIDINTALSQNEHLAKKYGVKGVPHIVKVFSRGDYVVYSGDRSFAHMKKWIISK